MSDSAHSEAGAESDVDNMDSDEEKFAGEYLVDFGKAYNGKLIRQCGKDWIVFCLSKGWSRYRGDFADAARAYLRYLSRNPGKCVVEFGQKHRNTPTEECRDIRWIEWCTHQVILLDRYPQWCEAAKEWLRIRDPRKYGVIRDIGERTDIDEWRWEADLKETAEEDYELDGFVVPDTESDEEGEEEHDEQEDEEESQTAQSTQDGSKSSVESLEDEDEQMESPSQEDEDEDDLEPRRPSRTRPSPRERSVSLGVDETDSEEPRGSDSASSGSVSEEGIQRRPHTRSQAALQRRQLSPTDDDSADNADSQSDNSVSISEGQASRPRTRSQAALTVSAPDRFDDPERPNRPSRAPRTPLRPGLPTPRPTSRRVPNTPPRFHGTSDDEDAFPSTPQSLTRPFQRPSRTFVPDSEGEDEPKRLLGASSPASARSSLQEQPRQKLSQTSRGQRRVLSSPPKSSQVFLTPEPTDRDMDEEDTPVQRPGSRPKGSVRKKRTLRAFPSEEDPPRRQFPTQSAERADTSGDENDDEPLSVRKTARKTRAVERELRRLFDAPVAYVSPPDLPMPSVENRQPRTLKRLFSSMFIKKESDADDDNQEDDRDASMDETSPPPRKRRRSTSSPSTLRTVRRQFIFD